MSEVATQTKTVFRKQIARIVPYVSGKDERMGLAKYGEAILPGTEHVEELVLLENNGIKRFLTGLDEFAPEVQKIQDEDKKKATIKKIRERVSYLEQTLNANVVDPEDKEFWSKVKMIHPSNHSFWAKQKLVITNEPIFLDHENPEGVLALAAIEAGGYTSVAKSFDDARHSPHEPRWYLDKETDTSSTKTEVKKLKNDARAKLDKMFKNDTTRMFYLVKSLDARSDRYKKSTSFDTIYDWLDEFIDGNAGLNAKRATQEFAKYNALPLEELKVRAVVNDASFYKIIQTRADSKIYHHNTGTMLGGNISEVVIYLGDQINQKVYAQISEEVEAYWNQ